MDKILTCILCPNGCELKIEYDEEDILSISGSKCGKGTEYAGQEIKNPMRNISSSVLVKNGDMPLCSVRLSAPIPKARIFDVMEEIRKVSVEAPVKAGDIIIKNVLDLGSDVIATRDIKN